MATLRRQWWVRLTGPVSALISPSDLTALLAGDPSPVVLDVQWTLSVPGAGPAVARGHEDYLRGHLPGAHFVDLDHVLAGRVSGADGEGRRLGGRHPLPDPSMVEAALRACGVRVDSAVVVYDQGIGWSAARAWWVLRHVGVRDVRVLDGGLAAWQGAGGPVTSEVPSPGAGNLVARPGGMPVLDADAAAELARTGLLLDARAADRYTGETEPLDPVAGHVPGAVSAPTTANLMADGRLLTPDRLRERFAGLGADKATSVGVYCGSGVSAAQQVLALHEAGIDAALYVGSWSDWVSDPARPVATGPAPG